MRFFRNSRLCGRLGDSRTSFFPSLQEINGSTSPTCSYIHDEIRLPLKSWLESVATSPMISRRRTNSPEKRRYGLSMLHSFMILMYIVVWLRWYLHSNSDILKRVGDRTNHQIHVGISVLTLLHENERPFLTYWKLKCPSLILMDLRDASQCGCTLLQ